MPERMNTERFRLKLKEVHGDAYNFDESEFNGWKEKVKIKCPVHGVLWINAYTLSKGSGCKQCNLKKTWKSGRKGGSRTWTKDEVEAKLKELHGENITFSGISESPKLINKVNAICSVHGEIKRKPTLYRLLVEKTGCAKCRSSETQINKNKRDYVSDFKKVHGNKYDYSQYEFKGTAVNVIVICPDHGAFPVSISNHLAGKGCRNCGIRKQVDARTAKPDEMVFKFNTIHNSKYTYEKMEWVNYHTEIIITCPNHGDFNQDPRNHLQGKGCPRCKAEKMSEDRSYDTESFVKACKETHGDFYDYSEVDYIRSMTDVTIICREHGPFSQRPSHHISGAGCPRCTNKSEGRIAKFLYLNFIIYRQFKVDNRRFDFYLPDFDLIIERDGEQHYHGFHLLADDEKLESLEKIRQADIEKTALAKQEGLTICRLPYWLNFKEEIIETINIIHGKPTYPDVPDLGQADTQPPPVIWDDIDYDGYVTTDENSEEDLDSFFDEDGQGSFDF